MRGICIFLESVLQGIYADEIRYFYGRYGGRTSSEVGSLIRVRGTRWHKEGK